MIKDGLLNGVDEIYGMHNMPRHGEQEIHCIVGPNMAEMTIIKITVIGKGNCGRYDFDRKLLNNPIGPSTQIYQRYLQLIDDYKT